MRRAKRCARRRPRVTLLRACAQACGGACPADTADVCAICLCQMTDPLDIALVKGCLHAYCAPCVVGWVSATAQRAGAVPGATPCPQCKASFTSLYVHRALDGTPTEHLVEEAVVLLRRAHWANACAAEEEEDSPSTESDEQLDSTDDEERLARAHRVRLIGNRRFGNGGFVSNGRLLARPVAPTPPPPPPPRKVVHKAQAEPKASPASSAAHAKRAKREAKAAQKDEKEAQRRARRLERLVATTAPPAASSGGACGGGDADQDAA